MSDDILARATKALREQTSPDASNDTHVDETPARIERSLRNARRGARTRARWIVWPLAAAFLVLTAWASASGELARLMKLATTHDTKEDVAPPAPAPTLLPAPAPTPTPAPLVLTPLPSESVAPKPPLPPAVDVDALYRDAHDAHFVRKDPEAALAAWDRYLAAAGPKGTFVLEARYNRALSLVRLGRKTEAATALRPFARGDYGGYRREEATKLLETLE